MSTYYRTEILSEQSIEEMIQDLRDCRSISDEIEKEATIASVFFTLVGIPIVFMATPVAMAVWAASLANAGYAVKLDNLENLCTKAIEKLEDYKDYLEKHDQYDLIKIEVKVEEVTYNGEIYRIPTDFEVIALHCTNPPGWFVIA